MARGSTVASVSDGNPKLWGDAATATDAPSLHDIIADWAYDMVWAAAGRYPGEEVDAAKSSRMDSAVAFLREAARQVPTIIDVTEPPGRAGRGQYVKTNAKTLPDGVLCVCGNQTHLGGFYPADARRGKLMSPEVGGGWDGYTVACMDCGLCIDTRPQMARPLPTTEQYGWEWEHPLSGWVAIPDDPDQIPGL